MPSIRHDYLVERELLDEARKADAWYRTKGMRVATPPAIPAVVAAWIVRNCLAPR